MRQFCLHTVAERKRHLHFRRRSKPLIIDSEGEETGEEDVTDDINDN